MAEIITYVQSKSSAPPPFSPTDIAGLKLWLKADAGVTLNGSTVSAWADQSGNGNDATQSVAIAQPTFVANALNGNPVIYFSYAGHDYFVLPNIDIESSSVFIVYKKILPLAGSYALLADGTNNTYSGILDWTSNQLFYNTKNNAYKSFTGGGNDDYVTTTFNSTGLYTNTHAYKNGIIQGAGNSQQSGTGGNLLINRIGFSQYFNSYFDGYIAEIIVYNNYLSEIQRQQVETYLHTKYTHY